MQGNNKVRDSGVSLTRVERKRRDTRIRIIQAAEHLFRNRSIDDVTLQDITEAADIGHGSFYLHFKSKYEVLIPIVQSQAFDLDKIFRQALPDETDPAEVIAISARIMGRVFLSDPLWRWLLSHSGVPVEDMRRAVGRFGDRDFQKGAEVGRFKVSNVDVMLSFAFGGFVNAIVASFDFEDPEPAIDANVEIMLRVFGISVEEARDISHRPLPDIQSVAS